MGAGCEVFFLLLHYVGYSFDIVVLLFFVTGTYCDRTMNTARWICTLSLLMSIYKPSINVCAG